MTELDDSARDKPRLSEEPLEFCDLSPSEIPHFGDKGYNWHNFSAAKIWDRHLNGEISIGLKIGTRLFDGDAENFFAIVRCQDGGGVTKGDYRDFLRFRTNGYVVTNARHLSGDDEKAMLVGAIQPMDGVDCAHVGRRVSIWLYRSNQFQRCKRNALYISVLNRLFEFFPLPTNRELMVVEGVLPGCRGQLDNQMVKDRTQMMNDFAEKNRYFQGNWADDVCLEDILEGVVIEPFRDAVRARMGSEKLIDLGVEIDDVFIGPVKLRLDTI